MKEQLYTIPVTDAFATDCECPICAMKAALEKNAIDYTMGPSYMEDDIRAQTDQNGFCEKHVRMLYKNSNRLGLALMLHTHMKKMIKDLENKAKEQGTQTAPSFFKKKTIENPVTNYITKLEQSCFVCNRIEQTFTRYLATVLYLYKKEADFRRTFMDSHGICTSHYVLLYDLAPTHLNGEMLTQFQSELTNLYLTHMTRVCSDLEWFIDKFDYRNADAPWKNAKDALPRALTKINSILDLES